jgi:hypothetical protein
MLASWISISDTSLFEGNMQIAALLIWLALCLIIAKLVNLVAKRPIMNPWLWFAASYGALYVIGFILGAVRGTPNLAYLAGYYLPITAIGVVLGLWKAPKWRAANETKRAEHASLPA